MQIVPSAISFVTPINGSMILTNLEYCGRVCYKSEDRITEDSAKAFVANIIKRGHESVLEHEKITVKIICDRGVSHELVRHRIASYSQESTRYCNYNKAKFGSELTFIRPIFWESDPDKYLIWKQTMQHIEDAYMELINMGAKPEEARSILPNSLKTEIIVTMNLREWRHFLRLRTSEKAHPQMRELTIPLLNTLKRLIPVIFDDINAE